MCNPTRSGKNKYKIALKHKRPFSPGATAYDRMSYRPIANGLK